MTAKEELAELGIIGRNVTWQDAQNMGDWLVASVIPLARVDERGRIRDAGLFKPYAILGLRSRSGQASLPVTHKVDFLHIWQASQRQQRDGGEVVVRIDGPGGIRARLTVHLVPAGAYAKVSSPGFRLPEDERELARLSPIHTWTWSTT